MNFRALHAKLKWFAVDVLLRRILIPIVLTAVYFLGVGATSLFARIFARRQLGRKQAGSTWVKAEGFEVGPHNRTWQS